MNTKKSILFLFSGFLAIGLVKSQDTVFFGQKVPSNGSEPFMPGLISTAGGFERAPFYSAIDSSFFYTTVGTGFTNPKIFRVHCIDTTYTMQQVNIPGGGSEPCLSSDGLYLYYTSSDDLWKADITDTIVSNRAVIPSPVSQSTSGDYHAAVSDSGTLFFCRTTDGYNYNLYKSNRISGQYNTVEKLGKAINSPDGGVDPYIAPDESFIIFGSLGQYGNTDMFISYKKNDGTWTRRKNIGPQINTEYDEYSQAVSPDKKYIFFTRENGWDFMDVYWAKAGFIDSLRLTNFEPYVLNNIPDREATTSRPFSYTVPDSIFYDDDGNNTLTYAASLSNGNPLPDSLDFVEATKTFTYTPAIAEILTIRVTATDTAGASVYDDFRLVVTSGSRIEMTDGEEEMSIFPNPTSGQFRITFGQVTSSPVWIAVYNTQGQKIINENIKNTDNIFIDMSGYTKGIYIVTAATGKKVITNKVAME